MVFEVSEEERREIQADPVNIVYGSVCFCCFLLGTVLNALSLFYFSKKKLHVSTINYIWIVSTDLLISMLAFPVSISYLTRRSPFIFQNAMFCQVWGVLWNAAARMSVFMVAVLSISRTISLRYPFRVIKVRVIMVLMVGYAATQLVQSTIPFWFGTVYSYRDTHIQCQWFFKDIKAIENGSVFYSVLMALELVLPVFPIITSCVLSISELRNQTQRDSRYSKGHRSASITVILVTVTYIIFNAPFCFYFVLATTDRYMKFRFGFFAFEDPSYNLRAFVVAISVIMNSAVNPLIYCFRFKRFRHFLLRVFQNRTGPDILIYDTSYPSQAKCKGVSSPDAVTSL